MNIFSLSEVEPSQSSKRAAFTLIELLVVIAIISILAAILFPVFGRARENARRSSCSSNMKQIGLGILQYTQDYDEFMPARAYNAGTANATNWQNIVQPYVKSYQLFQCPSNTRNRVNMTDDGAGNQSKVSYGANTTENTSDGGLFSFNGVASPISIAAIESPSTVISNFESNSATADFIISKAFFATVGGGNWGGGNNVSLFNGHLSTANYLFADGHVKSLKPTATLTPTNMWNRTNLAYTGAQLTNAQTVIQNATNFYK